MYRPGSRLAVVFLIENLAGQDLRQLSLAHAGTAEHPLALQVPRGRNDDDLVERFVAPGLEQQGNIE